MNPIGKRFDQVIPMSRLKQVDTRTSDLKLNDGIHAPVSTGNTIQTDEFVVDGGSAGVVFHDQQRDAQGQLTSETWRYEVESAISESFSAGSDGRINHVFVRDASKPETAEGGQNFNDTDGDGTVDVKTVNETRTFDGGSISVMHDVPATSNDVDRTVTGVGDVTIAFPRRPPILLKG